MFKNKLGCIRYFPITQFTMSKVVKYFQMCAYINCVGRSQQASQGNDKNGYSLHDGIFTYFLKQNIKG